MRMRLTLGLLLALSSAACSDDSEAPDGSATDARVTRYDAADAGPPDHASDGSTPLLTRTFMPNTTTISTSEGAPYGDCDFWVKTPAQCNEETDFGYGPTRVMRIYVCLSGEVSTSACSAQPAVTGPLSTPMVTDIATRIAAFAGTGMRLVVRFTYNFGPIGAGAMDAPLSVILTNLDQVAPILVANKDLIFAIEAGFIGTWGEWHDSTNGNETAEAQGAVLAKELSYFDGLFPILVRTPGALYQYEGTFTPPSGFGLHDDYYDSSATDGASFSPCATNAGYCLTGVTAAELESYAAAISATTMFIGEFPDVTSATMHSCAALDAYSYTYHLQSLGLTPSAAVASELTNEGCALDFYDKVGTRIELRDATVSGARVAGATVHVTLTMANAGYGRVIRARPANVVVLAGSTAVARIAVPLASLDLRTLSASASPTATSFGFDVTLPSNLPSTGVSLALSIPDPAPSLTAQAAYALPLNSVAMDGTAIFAPATGYNVFASW